MAGFAAAAAIIVIFADNLPFNDCDELFDVNGGLLDVGVVADVL